MEKLLIRASQAFKLLTEPKTKAAKEAGELSETTKTYLQELWLKNKYGYEEVFMTEEIMKGVETEQDSMTLLQNVIKSDECRLKNYELFKNEYICGTPDIILSDIIEDVKSSWSKKTFMNAELTPAYYTQLQCYMALTGRIKARLVYCLNQTPERLVTSEKQRYYYKFDCNEENPELLRIYDQIERNHDISMISEEERVKSFEFNYDEALINRLYSKIEQARIFYEQIKL